MVIDGSGSRRGISGARHSGLVAIEQSNLGRLCSQLVADVFPLEVGSHGTRRAAVSQRSILIDGDWAPATCRGNFGNASEATMLDVSGLGVSENGAEVDKTRNGWSECRTVDLLVAVATQYSIAELLGLGGLSGQDSEGQGCDGDQWECFVHRFSLGNVGAIVV